MRDTSAITRAVNELEAVQVALAAVSSRTDDRRRHDLIAFRRQLSQRIAEVSPLAEPLFAGLDRPELLQAYREKFSRMRSAAAMHQANWPAVRLDQVDDEYRRSVLAVREANRDFVSWMRATLAGLR